LIIDCVKLGKISGLEGEIGGSSREKEEKILLSKPREIKSNAK
jgi:hypothetical protein